MYDLRCPHCANEFALKRNVMKVTCPKCARTFLAVEAGLAATAPLSSSEPAKQGAVGSGATAPVQAAPVQVVRESGPLSLQKPISAPAADSALEQAQETALPSWMNPYGAAAAALAAIALVAAAVLAKKLLTIGLLAAGLALAMRGVWATRGNRKTSDVVSLTVGLGLCGLGLVLMLIAPALLNPFWAMDVALPRADPDKQVQVDHDNPREQGKPLSADDWTDALHAIRQDDLVLRVEGVKTGPLPDRDGQSCLQIHLRLANVGSERYIPFEGFAPDKHAPSLTDEGGHSYRFLEERRRKRSRGPKGRPRELVFEARSAEVVHLVPNRGQDRLLIFAGSPGKALKLELPAAAWGRRGVCKFRIAASFPADRRDLDQK
jgi:hypothetical protein